MTKVYQYNNYPFWKIKTFEVEKGRKPRKKRRLYKEILTFDIETTNFDDIKQSYLYIWMLYISGDYIVGRTIKQLQYAFRKIADYAEYNFIIFVHNLSFEFAFIRELFEWDSVTITRAHTILKCSAFDDKLQFRCSYLLTNMSLDKFTKRMGTTAKLSGELYNYDKKRLHNTKLNRYEVAYCLTDVKALHDALVKFIESEAETLYTLPLTSTGFVRRELKSLLFKEVGRKYGLKRQLTIEQYKLLRRAFRGGNTHANRFYVNKTLEAVASFDIKSSYPFQILAHKYPTGRYSRIYEYTEIEAFNLIKKGFSFVAYIAIKDVSLRDIYNPVPYIPLSKCLKCSKPLVDNGRILKADYLLMAVCDIDMKIIWKQYSFKLEKIKGMVGKKEVLPKAYAEMIMKYFKLKADIDKEKDAYSYARSKEKLNSIYGVTVTDVCRPNIRYEQGGFILTEPDFKKALFEHAKNSPLLYCIGVYVSAYARKELQDMIDIAGDDFRYCDTDSVKLAHVDRHIKAIEKFNNSIKANMKKYEYKSQIMGVFEYEGIYSKFRMLGAKKYAYIENDKLHVTIAGVRKDKGSEELGSIDNLKPDFTFKRSGGTEGRYNDYYGRYKYKGVEIEIRENLYLHGHDYTIGFGKDYKTLIQAILTGEYDYLF